MPVVISTKFSMKLYITKYMGAKLRAFAINIFRDMHYNITFRTAILKFKMAARYHVSTNFIWIHIT